MGKQQLKIVNACHDWRKRLDIAKALGYEKMFPDLIRTIESLASAGVLYKDQDTLPNGVIRYWYKATPQALQNAQEDTQTVQHVQMVLNV